MKAKAKLSLTNPRDAFACVARFIQKQRGFYT